jgi:DNA-binding NtrC family response regulator
MSTVLIVDDDARVREILARWLAPEGYETKEAPEAEAALEMLAAGGVAVALCDVMMPGRGGLWLVERMREAHPAVAVVLATGVENVHPSISLGGNVVNYLVKPFERATVLTAVREACGWHEAAVKKSEGGASGDPLAAWLQTGKPQRPDGK